MIDRQRVEAVLIRRFPTATSSQVAAATNAIMALAAEPADGRVGGAGWEMARFLSSDSPNAEDDPLLRTGAEHDQGARR